jgi:hypothetical protein
MNDASHVGGMQSAAQGQNEFRSLASVYRRTIQQTIKAAPLGILQHQIMHALGLACFVDGDDVGVGQSRDNLGFQLQAKQGIDPSIFLRDDFDGYKAVETLLERLEDKTIAASAQFLEDLKALDVEGKRRQRATGQRLRIVSQTWQRQRLVIHEITRKEWEDGSSITYSRCVHQ